MRRIRLLPLACPRFARGFTANLRERRDHQLHQLHVNLYQFYYLTLAGNEEAVYFELILVLFISFYPWVFSAGFLYQGYSATCRAPGSTLSLMTPQNLLIFSNLRRLILPKEIVQEENLFLLL